MYIYGKRIACVQTRMYSQLVIITDIHAGIIMSASTPIAAKAVGYIASYKQQNYYSYVLKFYTIVRIGILSNTIYIVALHLCMAT